MYLSQSEVELFNIKKNLIKSEIEERIQEEIKNRTVCKIPSIKNLMSKLKRK